MTNRLLLCFPWHEPPEGETEGHYAKSFDEIGAIQATCRVTLPDWIKLPQVGDTINYEQYEPPDAPSGIYQVTKRVLKIRNGDGRSSAWRIRALWVAPRREA